MEVNAMNKEKLYMIYLSVTAIINAIVLIIVQLFSFAMIAQFVYYAVNDVYYYGEEIGSLALIFVLMQAYKWITLKATKMFVDIYNE